jgi:hypothetical protein
MKLPVVNAFSTPYEAWHTRDATREEVQRHMEEHGNMLPFVNDSLKARISDHFEAASYMANHGEDNGLEKFIDRYLDNDSSYKNFRQAMPSKTPKAFYDFQQKYPHYSSVSVDSEINNIGHTLSEGQILFHGGLFPSSTMEEIVLTSPFSTSFCPQVALRNAEWKAKAYDSGQIDLLVLRASNPTTNVFAFRRKGTKMGNEKEVLFASGAKLRIKDKTLIRNNYVAAKRDFPDKTISIYVISVDIS